MLGSNHHPSSSRKQRWPKVLTALWALAVVAGLTTVWQYANLSAKATSPDPQWPSPGRVTLDREHPTLVAFVHPHCPCTRASVEQLSRIVAQSGGKVCAWIVVFHPRDADADWSKTDLVDQASQIPGAQVVVDIEGELARIFDVAASGHVLLYGPGGELLFSGGITASRGHVGDNVGASAITSHLNHESTSVRETPVFGCAIRIDSD